jgi:glutaredoxin
MAAELTRVPGRDVGRVVLYAITTCAWCRKTKAFLDRLGVEYHYVDVDVLEKEEKKETKDEVRRWNRKCSFPTLVINDSECVVGFDEAEIRRALGL